MREACMSMCAMAHGDVMMQLCKSARYRCTQRVRMRRNTVFYLFHVKRYCDLMRDRFCWLLFAQGIDTEFDRAVLGVCFT